MNVTTYKTIRHGITPDKTEVAAFSEIVVDSSGAWLTLRGEQKCRMKIDRSEQARELGEALIKAADLMVEQEKAAALNGKKAMDEVRSLTTA